MNRRPKQHRRFWAGTDAVLDPDFDSCDLDVDALAHDLETAGRIRMESIFNDVDVFNGRSAYESNLGIRSERYAKAANTRRARETEQWQWLEEQAQSNRGHAANVRCAAYLKSTGHRLKDILIIDGFYFAVAGGVSYGRFNSVEGAVAHIGMLVANGVIE